MKSLFPYAVMLALFLAGNRLVDRQQQFHRSNPASGSVQSASLIGIFTKNSTVSQMQLTSKHLPDSRPRPVLMHPIAHE